MEIDEAKYQLYADALRETFNALKNTNMYLWKDSVILFL